MPEIDRISDQIDRVFQGSAWHGDPLTKILEKVTPAQANQRPLPNAHSIWEITLHITAWKRVVTRRLREGTWRRVSEREDWPAVGDTSKTGWRAAVNDLHSAHNELLSAVRAMEESRLDQRVKDKPDDHTFYIEMQGIAQHDAYHAGQIALLKKALAAPETLPTD